MISLGKKTVNEQACEQYGSIKNKSSLNLFMGLV